MDARVLSAFTRVHSPSKTGVNALQDALLPAHYGSKKRARRINLPAWRIFPLTRVTRIFQKNVFTKTARAGPGGTPLGIFVARAPRAFRSDEKKVSRTGPYRWDLTQPMGAGNRRWLQTLVLGLFFATNTATSTCPGRMGLEAAGDRRPSYGARRTWRQAAGRSAILSPGLGFAGGDGLGWSTASVNQ